MVTKQQQLKWLAKNRTEFDFDVVIMSTDTIGELADIWDSRHYKITNKEWQQERYKMQKQGEKADSWHERGEFPPAGCECEVKENDGEWHKTHIVGFDDDGHCVYTTPWNSLARDYDGDGDQYNFRPLRTEREKAIDEMVSVILDYDGYMITSDTAELVARQLHDSGYHK